MSLDHLALDIGAPAHRRDRRRSSLRATAARRAGSGPTTFAGIALRTPFWVLTGGARAACSSTR